LRRTLKHRTVLYITRALEESRMSRVELADKLGLSLGRINQLLSIRGFGEYERVPLDLIYQIWNITKVPPTFLMERIIPPARLKEDPPPIH
jgi:transcriptional regulator with XRE-family HTH domain